MFPLLPCYLLEPEGPDMPHSRGFYMLEMLFTSAVQWEECIYLTDALITMLKNQQCRSANALELIESIILKVQALSLLTKFDDQATHACLDGARYVLRTEHDRLYRDHGSFPKVFTNIKILNEFMRTLKIESAVDLSHVDIEYWGTYSFPPWYLWSS